MKIKSFLNLIVALSSISAVSIAFATVKDGTYTTTVRGHNAPITVSVQIQDGLPFIYFAKQYKTVENIIKIHVTLKKLKVF